MKKKMKKITKFGNDESKKKGRNKGEAERKDERLKEIIHHRK